MGWIARVRRERASPARASRHVGRLRDLAVKDEGTATANKCSTLPVLIDVDRDRGVHPIEVGYIDRKGLVVGGTGSNISNTRASTDGDAVGGDGIGKIHVRRHDATGVDNVIREIAPRYTRRVGEI